MWSGCRAQAYKRKRELRQFSLANRMQRDKLIAAYTYSQDSYKEHKAIGFSGVPRARPRGNDATGCAAGSGWALG